MTPVGCASLRFRIPGRQRRHRQPRVWAGVCRRVAERHLRARRRRRSPAPGRAARGDVRPDRRLRRTELPVEISPPRPRASPWGSRRSPGRDGEAPAAWPRGRRHTGSRLTTSLSTIALRTIACLPDRHAENTTDPSTSVMLSSRVHVGRDHRAADFRPRDDHARADHRVQRVAGVAVVGEHELGRRQRPEG